jgi:hypothetical protein
MNLPFRPEPLDIFFTSGRDFISCVFNRASAVGWRRRRDYSVATHTGFLTHDHGQWFATELTEDGIEEDSFQKYLVGRKCKLHSVYRWAGFQLPEVRTRTLAHLAQLRQQDRGYDWRGAIACNRFFRWLRHKRDKMVHHCE